MEMINKVVAEIQKIKPYVLQETFLRYKVIVQPSKGKSLLTKVLNGAFKFENNLEANEAKSLVSEIDYYNSNKQLIGKLKDMLFALRNLESGIKFMPNDSIAIQIIGKYPGMSKEIINTSFSKKQILQFVSEVNQIL